MLLNRDREGIIIDCVIISYRGVGVNPNMVGKIRNLLQTIYDFVGKYLWSTKNWVSKYPQCPHSPYAPVKHIFLRII